MWSKDSFKNKFTYKLFILKLCTYKNRIIALNNPQGLISRKTRVNLKFSHSNKQIRQSVILFFKNLLNMSDLFVPPTRQDLTQGLFYRGDFGEKGGQA